MKPVISSKVTFLPRRFYPLPAESERILNRADILYILSLERLYYKKACADEINETAFMGVVDFIIREARMAGERFSADQIRNVLCKGREFES